MEVHFYKQLTLMKNLVRYFFTCFFLLGINNAAGQNLCDAVPKMDLGYGYIFNILKAPPPVPETRYNQDAVNNLMCFALVNLNKNTCMIVFSAFDQIGDLGILGAIHERAPQNKQIQIDMQIEFKNTGYVDSRYEFAICKYTDEKVFLKKADYIYNTLVIDVGDIIGSIDAYNANFNSQYTK